MRIAELDLDQAVKDALAGFETVDDLPDDLTTIDGIGDGRAGQIKAAIAAAGVDTTDANEDAGEDTEPDTGVDVVSDIGPEPTLTFSGELRDGRGILRATHRGVMVKLLVGPDEHGVGRVIADAVDRSARERDTFIGDDAVAMASSWGLDAADRLADNRPKEAERLVPIRDIKNASTEQLSHRLTLIGDPGGEHDRRKMEVKAEIDSLRKDAERIKREITQTRQAWREEAPALRAIVTEKAAIEQELSSRTKVAEKEDAARVKIARERAAKTSATSATPVTPTSV